MAINVRKAGEKLGENALAWCFAKTVGSALPELQRLPNKRDFHASQVSY